jgi:hypothetical protein
LFVCLVPLNRPEKDETADSEDNVSSGDPFLDELKYALKSVNKKKKDAGMEVPIEICRPSNTVRPTWRPLSYPLPMQVASYS